MSLLVLLATLALAVFAPAFHYHQFGEPTRMARDAGLSALLLGGCVMSVFGPIRSIRREIESGTVEMALAHPVSRLNFFLSKAVGAGAACLVFAVVVLGVVLTIVEGAAIGGVIAGQTGDIARLWGPCFAAGVATVVVPLVVGAVCNRFAGCRFVLSAMAVAAALSLLEGGWVACRDGAMFRRMLPAVVLIAVLNGILLSAASAFSIRLRAHASASAVGLLLVLLLPAVGNYYLSDALSKGGVIPWSYVALATAAALPLVLLFALLGACLANRRDAA